MTVNELFGEPYEEGHRQITSIEFAESWPGVNSDMARLKIRLEGMKADDQSANMFMPQNAIWVALEQSL